MKIRLLRFNAFLAAVALAVALGAGCKSPNKREDLSSLQLHIEVNADGTDRNGPVTIGRSVPFQVNVDKYPFVSERHLKEASVVEVNGGFAIRLQFGQQGTRLLEQFSSAQQGRRVAILAQWEGQGRWLGAPRIERRIANGLLEFTPDATREESDRLVDGLNEAIKIYATGRF
jgi:preprotein translocase subunit SecD